MFRPIRRKEKEISIDEAKELLRTARTGVLAVNGDGGYPYAVPINYLYDEQAGTILFHGSYAGHKSEAIRSCDKVCFTVTGQETVKQEEWAPFVQSAVVFGRCHMIEDRETVMETVKRFAMKYYPDEQTADEEIAVSGKAVRMFEIKIEYLTGKEIQER